MVWKSKWWKGREKNHYHTWQLSICQKCVLCCPTKKVLFWYILFYPNAGSQLRRLSGIKVQASSLVNEFFFTDLSLCVWSSLSVRTGSQRPSPSFCGCGRLMLVKANPLQHREHSVPALSLSQPLVHTCAACICMCVYSVFSLCLFMCVSSVVWNGVLCCGSGVCMCGSARCKYLTVVCVYVPAILFIFISFTTTFQTHLLNTYLFTKPRNLPQK